MSHQDRIKAARGIIVAYVLVLFIGVAIALVFAFLGIFFPSK